MIENDTLNSSHRFIVIYDYYKGTFIPPKILITESGACQSSKWANCRVFFDTNTTKPKKPGKDEIKSNFRYLKRLSLK